MGLISNGKVRNRQSLAELAAYVPLRLSARERHLLAVLEQTLHVSEYTDHVDVTVAARRGGLKTKRILDGILEACHISTGLAVASGQENLLADTVGEGVALADWSNGSKKNKASKKLLKKMKKKQEAPAPSEAAPPAATSWAARDPQDNAALFQVMFEIGRRNKVLNPTSMRTTYGKLMYLLQDAQNPTVAKTLGFSLHKDLVLVGPYLHQHECAHLLEDPRLENCVAFISDRSDTGERLDRALVDQLVQNKRRVTHHVVQHYAETTTLSEEDVLRVIESLADAIAYIESNVQPVQRMLQYLEDCFDKEKEGDFSLALRGSSRGGFSNSYARYGLSAYSSGSEGPTLSHSHGTQYMFVWQSLRLWCKVMWHMHHLWVCADADLLSTSTSYHLHNTGQGLNRVQQCPRVRRVMSSLLNETQQEAGDIWVGLSVIHLGDRDVPNALIFIDKYTQIPRFLNPLVNFIQSLPNLCEDERIRSYVETQFGSPERLKMGVLADYFKHGFDGSGDDGGSCIDGRLTSSWNWTSRIAKKDYYNIFMLSGFQGFDGSF